MAEDDQKEMFKPYEMGVYEFDPYKGGCSWKTLIIVLAGLVAIGLALPSLLSAVPSLPWF